MANDLLREAKNLKSKYWDEPQVSQNTLGPEGIEFQQRFGDELLVRREKYLASCQQLGGVANELTTLVSGASQTMKETDNEFERLKSERQLDVSHPVNRKIVQWGKLGRVYARVTGYKPSVSDVLHDKLDVVGNARNALGAKIQIAESQYRTAAKEIKDLQALERRMISFEKEVQEDRARFALEVQNYETQLTNLHDEYAQKGGLNDLEYREKRIEIEERRNAARLELLKLETELSASASGQGDVRNMAKAYEVLAYDAIGLALETALEVKSSVDIKHSTLEKVTSAEMAVLGLAQQTIRAKRAEVAIAPVAESAFALVTEVAAELHNLVEAAGTDNPTISNELIERQRRRLKEARDSLETRRRGNVVEAEFEVIEEEKK